MAVAAIIISAVTLALNGYVGHKNGMWKYYWRKVHHGTKG